MQFESDILEGILRTAPGDTFYLYGNEKPFIKFEICEVEEEIKAPEGTKFYYESDTGCILCDKEIPGITRELEDEEKEELGLNYWICEVSRIKIAELICQRFNGIWMGEFQYDLL